MKDTTILIILAAIGAAGYLIWKKIQDSQAAATAVQPDPALPNTVIAAELAGINQGIATLNDPGTSVQLVQISGGPEMDIQLLSPANDQTAYALAQNTSVGTPQYATDQNYAPYKQSPMLTKLAMGFGPYAGAVGDPYKLPLPPRTDQEIYADIAADPLGRPTAELVAKVLPATQAQWGTFNKGIDAALQQMVQLNWDTYGQGMQGIPIPSYYTPAAVLGMTKGQSGGNFQL